MTYQAVADALRGGASPQMLCTTCPWDRNCVSPPSVTSGEIDAKIADAAAQDSHSAAEARAAGQQAPAPTRTLLTAMVMGGMDTMGQFCPVLALRLRTSTGRRFADQVKTMMQAWDDGA